VTAPRGVVLDTHAWVFWADGGDQLTAKARRTIASAQAKKAVYVSAISAWEVALLSEKGRLALSIDVTEWIARATTLPGVQTVSLDVRTAVDSVRLPGDLHKDPADRMIAATARRLGVPLVTADARLRAYSHLRTIW